MRFDVLTLFPELVQSHLDYSIMKRAKEDGVIEVNTIITFFAKFVNKKSF